MLYSEFLLPQVSADEESLESRLPKLFTKMRVHSKQTMQKWPYSQLNKDVDELTGEIIEVTRELQAADVTQVWYHKEIYYWFSKTFSCCNKKNVKSENMSFRVQIRKSKNLKQNIFI